MENVYDIAKWIAAVSIIATPIIALVRKWMLHDKRIEVCEKQSENICKSLNQMLAENKIQIAGILACLEGLREQGCNGAVTRSIVLINDFINDTAHKEI